MARRIAPVSQLRGQRCPASCRFDRGARGHHDWLLRVDRDPDRMLELLELAMTWNELDYDTDDMIDPREWAEFAGTHRWDDPDRAVRIFSLASDIAQRCKSTRDATVAALPETASVYSALTGRAVAVVR